jgi:hypothetical protein
VQCLTLPGPNRLSRIVTGIDSKDATERYNLEEADNKLPCLPNLSVESATVTRKVISWEDGDLENPYNFSSVSSISQHQTLVLTYN